MAKKDRKKTCWPAGTPAPPSEVAFTIAAMMVKTVTLRHFSKMPRSGLSTGAFIFGLCMQMGAVSCRCYAPTRRGSSA